jgi:hypothetical protein
MNIKFSSKHGQSPGGLGGGGYSQALTRFRAQATLSLGGGLPESARIGRSMSHPKADAAPGLGDLIRPD